ncbi:MAG: HAMP domain-containing sensor histidine kinase [Polyangiaceae bacterium]
MRLGIRLQMLLALGVLLVLAFVPLYFAVASLTRATLRQVRADAAVSLGRAVAGHVAVARETRAPAELEPLLSAQLGTGGVAAAGIYDSAGRLTAHVAEEGWRDSLPPAVTPVAERIEPVRTPAGTAQLLVLPQGQAGSVAVLVRTDARSSYSAPLLRLVALYTGIFGLGLLVFAYLAVTRLVVRPVVEISGAARRVREGARRFEVTGRGGAELVDLSHSLAQMTERLRVEEEELRRKIAEVERYAEDLTRAQERLVRSERLASVGRLAAGLAHEIGNPLSAILGFHELLQTGDLPREEELDFLARMKRETERIHKVLRDLLDFARPAAAPRDRDSEPAHACSAEGAVTGAVALVLPQKDWKGIDLTTDLDPGLPLVAIAEPRLVQLLLNLLLNAGDAVPSSGGKVSVRARPAPGGRVHIEVEDNGPGIAPDIEDRLFEPFVTTKEVGAGTGLGLAVCRGIAEDAAGSITVTRGPLGGALFLLDLPAAP